jgi:hypothetical protein
MLYHHFAKDPEVLVLFKDTKRFPEFKRKVEKLSTALPVKTPRPKGRGF